MHGYYSRIFNHNLFHLSDGQKLKEIAARSILSFMQIFEMNQSIIISVHGHNCFSGQNNSMSSKFKYHCAQQADLLSSVLGNSPFHLKIDFNLDQKRLVWTVKKRCFLSLRLMNGFMCLLLKATLKKHVGVYGYVYLVRPIR